MRIAALGLLAALVSASGAAAADLDYGYLRGADDDYAPAPDIDWSGFYIGGHGGYSSAPLGFGSSSQSIVANALRSTYAENELKASSLLSTQSTNVAGLSYGVYAGYNAQFEDFVFGLEADYTFFNRASSGFDQIARSMTTSNGYETGVALRSLANTKIEDYGSIRGRLGYAFGSFLPYVTGGVAVGRATVSDKVSIQSYEYDKATYTSNLTAAKPAYVNNYGFSSFVQADPGSSILAPSITYGATKKVVIGGVAVGAGLEFALTSNIILRGEYQYVLFNDFKGHSAEINTVRGGAAVKF